MSEYLDEKLKEYAKTNVYPFHMPGHKRHSLSLGEPALLDITEINGFDDLHAPHGILREAMERAAHLWGSENAYFLVNGSSCGMLAALSAGVSRGGHVLVARNCHKSVYHAIELRQLDAHYIYPSVTKSGIQGAIDPEKIRQYLETTHSRLTNDLSGNRIRERDQTNGTSDAAKMPEAVVITSPTYDGVVSDVKTIASVCHEYKVPLIVDEAHGAHLGFHSYFPLNAIQSGADIVVQSLHKTLPSLTQTAILHVNSALADRKKIEHYLDIYQTTSPSYVLMAGMDACVRILSKQSEALFENYAKKLERFRQAVSHMKHLHLITEEDFRSEECYAFDPSKLLISTKYTGLNGYELSRILRSEYQIETEMSAATYVTALTSMMDTEEGFERLSQALIQIDASLLDEASCWDEIDRSLYSEKERVYLLSDALERDGKEVPLDQAGGFITKESMYLYPPGIPILVPGERIPKEIVRAAAQMMEAGFSLQGPANIEEKRIEVVKS